MASLEKRRYLSSEMSGRLVSNTGSGGTQGKGKAIIGVTRGVEGPQPCVEESWNQVGQHEWIGCSGGGGSEFGALPGADVYKVGDTDECGLLGEVFLKCSLASSPRGKPEA